MERNFLTYMIAFVVRALLQIRFGNSNQIG